MASDEREVCANCNRPTQACRKFEGHQCWVERAMWLERKLFAAEREIEQRDGLLRDLRILDSGLLAFQTNVSTRREALRKLQTDSTLSPATGAPKP